MTATTAFDLDKLFEGSLRRLRTEAEYFSRLTDHNPELGRLNETHLVHGCRQTIHPAVMPGLDPGIQRWPGFRYSRPAILDRRVEPGDDN